MVVLVLHRESSVLSPPYRVCVSLYCPGLASAFVVGALPSSAPSACVTRSCTDLSRSSILSPISSMRVMMLSLIVWNRDCICVSRFWTCDGGEGGRGRDQAFARGGDDFEKEEMGGEPRGRSLRRGPSARSEGIGLALTNAVRSAVDWGPSPWLLMSASPWGSARGSAAGLLYLLRSSGARSIEGAAGWSDH